MEAKLIIPAQLIDEETVDLLIAKDAFLVPTLVTYDRIRAEGVEAGMPAALVDKVSTRCGTAETASFFFR